MTSTQMKKELLEEGLNYSITPTTIPAVELVAKIETVLAGMPTEEADSIRADLSRSNFPATFLC